MSVRQKETARSRQIAEELVRDAESFVAEDGGVIQSRQIRALARAVALQLADLEAVLHSRTDDLA